MTRKDSQALNLTRALLLIGVVFIHSRPYIENIDEMTGWGYTVVGAIAELWKVCVPGYFIISGFLFFYNMPQLEWYKYRQKLKSRIYTLLIPYLLWNIIKIIITFVIAFVTHGDVQGIYVDGHLHVLSLLKSLWLAQYPFPTYIPLWFVRNLMCFVLLSPIIYLLVKNKWIGGVICIICLIYDDYPYWLMGIDFYIVGAYISLHRGMFKMFHLVDYRMWLVGYIALALWHYFGFDDEWWHIIVFKLLVACGVLFYWQWAYRISAMRESKLTSILNPFIKGAFFIYCAHGLITYPVHSLVERVISPFTSVGYLCDYFIVWTVVIILTFILYLLMKKFTPRLLAVLSGNRN